MDQETTSLKEIMCTTESKITKCRISFIVIELSSRGCLLQRPCKIISQNGTAVSGNLQLVTTGTVHDNCYVYDNCYSLRQLLQLTVTVRGNCYS